MGEREDSLPGAALPAWAELPLGCKDDQDPHSTSQSSKAGKQGSERGDTILRAVS